MKKINPNQFFYTPEALERIQKKIQKKKIDELFFDETAKKRVLSDLILKGNFPLFETCFEIWGDTLSWEALEDTILHQAVEKGLNIFVEHILTTSPLQKAELLNRYRQVSDESKPFIKETPLHIAVRKQYFELVKYLISKGANVQLFATRRENGVVISENILFGEMQTFYCFEDEHPVVTALIKENIPMVDYFLTLPHNFPRIYYHQAPLAEGGIRYPEIPNKELTLCYLLLESIHFGKIESYQHLKEHYSAKLPETFSSYIIDGHVLRREVFKNLSPLKILLASPFKESFGSDEEQYRLARFFHKEKNNTIDFKTVCIACFSQSDCSGILWYVIQKYLITVKEKHSEHALSLLCVSISLLNVALMDLLILMFGKELLLEEKSYQDFNLLRELDCVCNSALSPNSRGTFTKILAHLEEYSKELQGARVSPKEVFYFQARLAEIIQLNLKKIRENNQNEELENVFSP